MNISKGIYWKVEWKSRSHLMATQIGFVYVYSAGYRRILVATDREELS